MTRLSFQMHNADWLDSPWDGFFVEGGANLMKPPMTGIEEDNMAHILSKVSSISVADFVPHSGIKRILKGGYLRTDEHIGSND